MMIRNLCTAMLLCLLTLTIQAQDGGQHIKYAKRALSAYLLNSTDNADKLMEAQAELESAYSSEGFTADYKSELLKSQVYTELAAKDYQALLLSQGEAVMPQHMDEAVGAVSALKSALSKAEKKFEVNQVLKSASELAPYLSTMGNTLIGQKSFDKAFGPLNAVLEVNNMLTSNGEESIFETTADMDNHKYVTAVCADKAEMGDVAMKYLTELAEADSKEVGVYSTLFNMHIDDDTEKAMTYLEKGREIDPENLELLYAEINYYIKEQQFDVLSEKLEMAVQKDPNNPQIYAALGNVYTNLSDAAATEGDMTKADEYFEQSKSYYEKTIELDAESFDAQYSLGSLYYNKAASMTKQMQDLGLSKEDQMKFEELEKASAGLFDEALPYFQKAEMINPNDINTIIALKEIFARKDDLETAGKFKERLETVQGGGEVDGSFFK